jgi:hypothetical protein
MAHGYAGVKEHGIEPFADAFVEDRSVVLLHDRRTSGPAMARPRQDAMIRSTPIKFLARSALSPVGVRRRTSRRPTTGERRPETLDSLTSRGFDDAAIALARGAGITAPTTLEADAASASASGPAPARAMATAVRGTP